MTVVRFELWVKYWSSTDENFWEIMEKTWESEWLKLNLATKEKIQRLAKKEKIQRLANASC